MNPRPFIFSGLWTLLFAAVMLVTLLNLDDGPSLPLARGATALLAALALVATEALWRPRPWTYRAVSALALAHTVIAVVMGVVIAGAEGLGIAGGWLFFSGFVVVPVLAAVYQASAAAYGPGWQRRRVRAPAATPRP